VRDFIANNFHSFDFTMWVLGRDFRIAAVAGAEKLDVVISAS